MLDLYRIIVVVLVGTFFGGGGGVARATCGNWEPVLAMAPAEDHESAAFHFSWTTVVASCAPDFAFDHYLICTLPGTSAPTTPYDTDAQCTAVYQRTEVEAPNHFVHRSSKAFSARIFACGASPCTDIYGDGSNGTVTANSDLVIGVETDPEVWVLEEVMGFDDISRLILDGNASASGALMYPTDFDDADMLGIWWSTEVSSVEVIRHKRAQDTGWQSWNTYSNWTSPDTDVAREPVASPTGAYTKCTHPWVAAVDQDSTQFIRLFVHCGATGATSVYSVDSVDEYGADFEMTCTDTGNCAADTDTCTYDFKCDWDNISADEGVVTEELCHDESAGCEYLDNSGHGRMMWEYIAEGAVDFSWDEPQMLFTGSPMSSGGSPCDDAPDPDNLYVADWDISGTPYWDVATSGSCPTHDVFERHDPGVIPLPNGEFKAYYKGGTTQFYVAYWNTTAWVDEVAIELAFDDAMYPWSINSTLQTCLENVDALVYIDSGTPVEGAFFREAKHNGSNGCFSTTGTSGGAFGGIVYAEHRN